MKGIFKYFKIFIFSYCVLSLAGCSSIPLLRQSTYLEKLYRRIPYKVKGQYRVVDIFYATDRKIKGSVDSLKAFTPKLGDKLSYGIVSVGIDPGLRIGKMLPGLYKRKRIIGLQKTRELNEGAFMHAVSYAVEKSPHKSLLILVMGYKDDFESTTIKASYLSYLLDIDTPVILFDWPGDQGVSIGGYLRARRLAEESGPYMGHLLAKIIHQIKPKKLWIEASSLGCQVVCSAFEYMYKHDELKDEETEIHHVILSAPDVGEKEFNEEFQNEIIALSKSLTAYVSSDDTALLLSGIIDGEKKFGRQTIRVKKPEQLDEAKSLLYLKSLDPDRISIVDVTPINEASYRHGYYLEAPEYFDDFYLRILDTPPHTNRRLYLLKTKDGVDYWVMQSEK